MSDDDYCVATSTSVCIVRFGTPHRRRVWKMLTDDKQLGLKTGDLVVSDPTSKKLVPLAKVAVTSGTNANQE